ncbi:MAG: efflux RND transporter periplasmic adaptor subunit [Bacteroides sp.]|nr:efflux RND transporter periplasmic adaptor subunit [Bacteroides sp.]MCM1412960.1 efflux RND transporter periplasmic adaptor subunit [Bacteroides sp.]MCM1471666.1 efflux RND transporter periplasmic adaptor subunit [Bacteroides sp.]
MFQLSNFKHFIALGAVTLLLASCGKSNPDIYGGNTKPVRVKVMSATGSSANTSDAYSGTIEAGNSTTVSFSVAGTINSIAVQEGQQVAKGQLIATVDGASLKSAYSIAEATLRETQDAYNRMKKLHDANALPDMQWVSVQEKLKQAEAAASIARTGMNDATITAPISGVVAHKLADVGQTMAPGIPVVELMDVSSLKVKISVPEVDLAKLKKGDVATITVGDRTYSGKLTDMGVAANALSRTYDVKFLINDPDGSLHPGMICSVAVDGVTPAADSTSTADVILPPTAVVLDFDNTSYVWVKKNGVARRLRVDVGGLDSRGIIITGGLQPSDSVIVEGQQKLSNGLKVEPVN